MVNLTVGVGGDFADWGLFWRHIYNMFPWVSANLMDDDYTGTQISDINEATGIVTGGGFWIIQMNGHSITLRNPDGFTTTMNNASHRYNFRATQWPDYSNSTVIVDGLKIYNNAESSMFFNSVLSFIGGNPNVEYNIHAIFKNVEIYGICVPVTREGYGIYTGGPGGYICQTDIYNCKIYGCLRGIEGKWTTNQVENHRIENCSLYDNTYGLYMESSPNPALGIIGRNIVCAGSLTADYHSPVGNTGFHDLYNCADSDNSMVATNANLHNCQPNIVPADEFQSLDIADSNWLDLKIGTRTWV